MSPDKVKRTRSEQALRGNITKLKREIAKRDTRIVEFEAVIRRQMDLLERYDRASSRLKDAGKPAAAGKKRSGQEYERLVGLLDRSIVRAEQLTREKQEVEKLLDRVLQLLDSALAAQERLAQRIGTAPSADAGDQTVLLEKTIARYENLLERALGALEYAHRTNEQQKHEIDQRDQYLQRTLNALHDALKLHEALARKPDTSAYGHRDADAHPEALAKYDEMLERSLAALERAYQTNEDQKKQISERDRLLSRTLDTLQNLVETGGEPPKDRRAGIFSRFFS